MRTSLWIGFGSALGGATRFAIDESFIRLGVDWFPWSTLAVNALGAWLIGFVAALTMFAERMLLPGHVQQFLMGGFCGGVTTFSILSLQTLQLMQEHFLLGCANILATLLVCTLAVWRGHRQGKRLSRSL